MSDVSHVRASYQPLDTPQQNPKELEAKHRDEVREINETHRAEIEKLKEENKKRIDAIHNEQNAKMNEKDVQHQKEIESVRAMYNKRLQQGSSEV